MALILSGDTGVPASGMPTGSVIQTVQVSSSTQYTTGSSSLSNSGLNASITPISSTSKILVICAIQAAVNSAGGINGIAQFSILKNNTTNLFTEYVRTYNYGSVNGIYQNNPCNITYLDSPATTSSVNYSIWIACTVGNAAYVNNDSGSSTITLLEIHG
jgi:hypothetical protein